LKTSLPQDSTTQTAFTNLFNDISGVIRSAELYALEDLLQLKDSLLMILPNYVYLEDKLEVLIEAAQKKLGLPVTPASK
jgi:hypothetical protein